MVLPGFINLTVHMAHCCEKEVSIKRSVTLQMTGITLRSEHLLSGCLGDGGHTRDGGLFILVLVGRIDKFLISLELT